MLTNLLEEMKVAGEIIDFGIVRDRGTELDAALSKAANECDILITTGGVSMGEMDLVKPYLE
jgi:gephyrin